MDNLTHSLAGAVLGQMGLKKKTGLGMATLIIAANIPDIDAVATLLGGVQHLAIRRGITHGPIAMLLLPLLLTGIMIGFDRWQTKRGKRPVDRLPIHKGWLLALAYIGCLSHPALDWLNSYGIRLLEPFSSQWFYGDSIFIIDIWIWVAFIAGVWVSRRREKKGIGNWQRPAWISFAVVCAYIFTNGLITGKAEAETRQLLVERAAESGLADVMQRRDAMVVANPVPLQFWKREILWRDGAAFGSGEFALFNRLVLGREQKIPGNAAFLESEVARLSKDGAAFLFWSRMPVVTAVGARVTVKDQRFMDPLVGDRFTVRVNVRKDRLERPRP
ncbi:MAG: metal-dependent hydrolase [Sphingomonadales bacterium]|nr:metal-dependent hydrolase [Sphingomonadales bacterium]NCO48741.1 metal-dependent hydrolase [Sphingomonadales bacterium]NCO99924.1 metal-dependent hydrolase [Sphingomonadales bacterium]NCP28244.1 metal-dependent hydrolase [Sphingomonadales bacterium]NCP44570.1 metal-dependent hydrolase [Sphingomonadales bacterium]